MPIQYKIDGFIPNKIITGKGFHKDHRVLVVKARPYDHITTYIRLRCLTCNQRKGWGFYHPGIDPWDPIWQFGGFAKDTLTADSF